MESGPWVGGCCVLPVEFYGRHVLQTRMRSHRVVMTAPVLDQGPNFLPRSEPILVQTLIAKPPIEALIGVVLPRLAKVVQGGLSHRIGWARLAGNPSDVS